MMTINFASFGCSGPMQGSGTTLLAFSDCRPFLYVQGL